MRRVLVAIGVVCISAALQLGTSLPATAGCQGSQRYAYPCNTIPCFDENNDGVLECLGAGDISVDLSVQP